MTIVKNKQFYDLQNTKFVHKMKTHCIVHFPSFFNIYYLYMWIILAVLLLFFVWRYREPMDTSPYDMVQEQAGVIQQLHETLAGVTFTEASIDALQDENDQTTDQINQLQQNMPSTEPQQQYPAE